MRSSRFAGLVPLVVLLAVVSGAFAQERPDALILYRQGRYREAVEVCIQELNERPFNMESHVVISWSYLRLQDYDSVLTYAQAALRISRYDARIMEILGEVYFYKGNNLESLTYFQEYINLNPTGSMLADVYFFMGEIFIRLGEFHRADIALSTAAFYKPNDARMWARVGYAREMVKDFQYALIAYEQALRLNSRLEEALRGRERVKEAL